MTKYVAMVGSVNTGIEYPMPFYAKSDRAAFNKAKKLAKLPEVAQVQVYMILMNGAKKIFGSIQRLPNGKLSTVYLSV
jgi:hypothetical protein